MIGIMGWTWMMSMASVSMTATTPLVGRSSLCVWMCVNFWSKKSFIWNIHLRIQAYFMLFRSVHELETLVCRLTACEWMKQRKDCLANTISDMQANRFSYALLLVMVWLSFNYYICYSRSFFLAVAKCVYTIINRLSYQHRYLYI